MDVEGFSQCLQYISSTSTKLSGEKFMPVASALCGAIIGFFLNYITSVRKEGKASKNKVLCCEEDIERIRVHTVSIIKNIAGMCISTAACRRTMHHSLPPSIGSLCLSEYFIDVAHKFNKSQRESVQKLIVNLDRLNDLLPKVTDSLSLKPYDFSVYLLNIAYSGLTIISECEDFIRKEIVVYEEDEVLGWLDASDEELQALSAVKVNAQQGNRTLRLSEYKD